jgi:hypothetical protein
MNLKLSIDRFTIKVIIINAVQTHCYWIMHRGSHKRQIRFTSLIYYPVYQDMLLQLAMEIDIIILLILDREVGMKHGKKQTRIKHAKAQECKARLFSKGHGKCEAKDRKLRKCNKNGAELDLISKSTSNYSYTIGLKVTNGYSKIHLDHSFPKE